MTLMIRLALAVVLGYILGKLIAAPLFMMGLWTFRPVVFIGTMALVWFLLPSVVPKLKSTQTVTPKIPKGGPPLSTRQEGEWTVIVIRPVPMPTWGYVTCALPAGIVALFILGSMMTGASQGGVVPLIVAVGVGFVLYKLLSSWMLSADRKKRLLNTSPFAVNSQAIRLPNGEVLPRDRVIRYTMHNTQSGQILFYGGNSIQRTGQTLAARTHQVMVPISWAVQVEHAGMSTYLAGGLTEELAHAVLHEISNRMGGLAFT